MYEQRGGIFMRIGSVSCGIEKGKIKRCKGLPGRKVDKAGEAQNANDAFL